MKKLVIMAAFALSSATMFAQQAVGTWSVTPKVGMTIANLSGDVVDAKSKIGLVAGAEAEYQITDMISVTGGLFYSMQGAKSKYELRNESVKENLDYLNIPVLCNVYVAKGLAVKLGAQLGINVSSKLKYDNITEDIGDNIEAVDFSIPVGLSYEYQNFVLDARYNWGLSNIVKGSGDNSVRNSVFQITLGYKIPF